MAKYMTEEEEVEYYRKQIAGKLVTWTSTHFPHVYADAILIQEPGHTHISVKPYGYDPEEIYLLYCMSCVVDGDERCAIPFEEILSPKFCFSNHNVNFFDEESAKYLASLEDGEEYLFGRANGFENAGSHPICIY